MCNVYSYKYEAAEELFMTSALQIVRSVLCGFGYLRILDEK